MKSDNKTLGIRNVPKELKDKIRLEAFYESETIQQTVIRILEEYFKEE